VPGLVVAGVIVALVALWITQRSREIEAPDVGEPTPPEVVLNEDPQLAKMRQDTIVTLQRVVDRWTRDPDQPWLLMHGTLVWGPQHRTLDGEPAGIHMFDHFVATKVLEGREIQYFPIDDPKGARIDAHIDQTLKTLVEVGIPDPRAQQLAQDARWKFQYDPSSPDNPFVDGNEAPWAAQAICQTAREGEESFVTFEGHTVDLRTMTGQLVTQMEKESRFLDDIRQAGDTTYDKKRQGIFRYTCGGTHLYMGADACVAAGFGTQEHSERLAYQMDLLFWRMTREIEAVNAALDQAPNMAPLLVEQRLKYLGHFLEAEAKAELHGTFVPNDHHRDQLAFAERALYQTVDQLQQMGVFDRLDTFKDDQYEYYLFTAGDCCHALHALNLQEQLAAQRRGGDYETPQPVYPSEQADEAAEVPPASTDSL
jgi:hypothetical protein